MLIAWNDEKEMYGELSFKASTAERIDMGEDWEWAGPYIREGYSYSDKQGYSNQLRWLVCFESCGRIVAQAKTKTHAIRKAKRVVKKQRRKVLRNLKYYLKKQGAAKGYDKEELIEYCEYLMEEM